MITIAIISLVLCGLGACYECKRVETEKEKQGHSVAIIAMGLAAVLYLTGFYSYVSNVIKMDQIRKMETDTIVSSEINMYVIPYGGPVYAINCK